MLQITPDWTKRWTASQFISELRMPFHGPGIYLNKTDTIIVVPLPPSEGKVEVENIWNIDQPSNTIYEVAVYNCKFEQTIFSAVARAPRCWMRKEQQPVHLAHLNLAGVKEALDNRGYGSEDILYAAFESFNQDNKAVYKIRYEDIDTPGGIGEGHVYLWEEDGKVLADF